MIQESRRACSGVTPTPKAKWVTSNQPIMYTLESIQTELLHWVWVWLQCNLLTILTSMLFWERSLWIGSPWTTDRPPWFSGSIFDCSKNLTRLRTNCHEIKLYVDNLNSISAWTNLSFWNGPESCCLINPPVKNCNVHDNNTNFNFPIQECKTGERFILMNSSFSPNLILDGMPITEWWTLLVDERDRMIESGQIKIGSSICPIQVTTFKKSKMVETEIFGRVISLAAMRKDHLKQMSTMKLLRRTDVTKKEVRDWECKQLLQSRGGRKRHTICTVTNTKYYLILCDMAIAYGDKW